MKHDRTQWKTDTQYTVRCAAMENENEWNNGIKFKPKQTKEQQQRLQQNREMQDKPKDDKTKNKTRNTLYIICATHL